MAFVVGFGLGWFFFFSVQTLKRSDLKIYIFRLFFNKSLLFLPCLTKKSDCTLFNKHVNAFHSKSLEDLGK